MKNKIFLSFICILLFSTLGFAKELDTIETIEKVLSGDMFKLSNGKKVRLIGVDAPENEVNEKAKEDSKRTGQELKDIIEKGKKSTEWVKANLEGKKIFLRYDKKLTDERGAQWAYVYLYDESLFFESVEHLQLFTDVIVKWWDYSKPSKYVFINATIIKAGYATPVKDPPNIKYADLFKGLYWEAKEKSEGLWNVDYFERPCTEEGGTIGNCLGCVIRCCKNLRPAFDQVMNGKCTEYSEPDSGGYCTNCGNNICESKLLENGCNCPEDCK